MICLRSLFRQFLAAGNISKDRDAIDRRLLFTLAGLGIRNYPFSFDHVLGQLSKMISTILMLIQTFNSGLRIINSLFF